MKELTDDQIDAFNEKIVEVTENYEALKESLRDLMNQFEKSERSDLIFCKTRFTAYNPGSDPGYDWGMGHNAYAWFEEWTEAVDSAVFGERPYPDMGPDSDAH
jgi:hypothetical protein